MTLDRGEERKLLLLEGALPLVSGFFRASNASFKRRLCFEGGGVYEPFAYCHPKSAMFVNAMVHLELPTLGLARQCATSVWPPKQNVSRLHADCHPLKVIKHRIGLGKVQVTVLHCCPGQADDSD